MAFDFDIEYVKGNQDLDFTRSQKIKQEFEDTFLYWVETDVLSLDRMAAEAKHDPVLSRITLRIREQTFGEIVPGRKDPKKK